MAAPKTRTALRLAVAQQIHEADPASGLAHPGLAEGRHLLMQRTGQTQQGYGDGGAAGFAESQAQIEQRIGIQRGHDAAMSRFRGAVREQQPIAHLGLQAHGGKRRCTHDEAVDQAPGVRAGRP
jgi:hypothetical protein